MKLPSLNYLAQQAIRSFLRFPFSILSSLVAVMLGVWLNEATIANKFPGINIMLCCALGISLFFCADIYADNKKLPGIRRRIVEAVVVFILIGLYFTLPNSDNTQNTNLPYIRYAIYSITAHLLVAIIPFLGAGKLNGFWHYNKILFVRFLTAMLYSGFLYGGLALALSSLNFLFDIDLHKELFFDLFIIISGFFNTWFFLAGIPENFDELDNLLEYPKGIRIFSQYVLLPLLIIYLVILYVYAGKIFILWSWPKGIVSYLIASVGVLGILTLLLIHPYGTLPGNSWIKKFSRIYYFILSPLVVLLFIAIGMRVADYGITINRYIIILLGIWLVIVCTYFGAGKTNIKFIPISLACMLMTMSFGPWGMFSVSERSQINRLKVILEQGNILKEGKVQREVVWQRDSLPQLYPKDVDKTNDKNLSDSLHNEVRSIIYYLDEHHGFTKVQKWYKQDLDSISRVSDSVGLRNERWYMTVNEADLYMRSLGLENTLRFKMDVDWFDYGFNKSANPATDIRGYDFLAEFQTQGDDDRKSLFFSFDVAFKEWHGQHNMRTEGKLILTNGLDTLTFSVDSLISKAFEKYGKKSQRDMPADEMILKSHSKNVEAKILLDYFNIKSEKDSLAVTELEGRILLRNRK